MYIVMELIEGVSLSDVFTSLKEKQQQFTEGRVWNIFIQVKLATHICVSISQLLYMYMCLVGNGFLFGFFTAVSGSEVFA